MQKHLDKLSKYSRKKLPLVVTVVFLKQEGIQFGELRGEDVENSKVIKRHKEK